MGEQGRGGKKIRSLQALPRRAGVGNDEEQPY